MARYGDSGKAYQVKKQQGQETTERKEETQKGT